MPTPLSSGRLACIGLGMLLGAHLTPRARTHLTDADVVFVAASDPLVELWLQRLRPDARSLQPMYAEGKSRRITYNEMAEAMLDEVDRGRYVCGAFYGHPGVFAEVPHACVARARARGFEAEMEPGISAEDCLYADLGIDPGRYGCQHYEASQLLFYRRQLDPSAYLVIWQVGFVGDRSYRRYATSPEHRALLVERLARDYPRDHEVLVYEARTTPLGDARMERMPLYTLVDSTLHMHSTLVVPPAVELAPDHEMLRRIARLERTTTVEAGQARPRLRLVST